ncbi:unnamed protein product [Owenia fusiformis]|uniref:Uncharacterized protein n=1 Tax=Owenia fusiformis TaxID=6347 RepID=A0A8J1UKP2_OWEFU|nr:unnamed protein product [Owenia fusiformis]
MTYQNPVFGTSFLPETEEGRNRGIKVGIYEDIPDDDEHQHYQALKPPGDEHEYATSFGNTAEATYPIYQTLRGQGNVDQTYTSPSYNTRRLNKSSCLKSKSCKVIIAVLSGIAILIGGVLIGLFIFGKHNDYTSSPMESRDTTLITTGSTQRQQVTRTSTISGQVRTTQTNGTTTSFTTIKTTTSTPLIDEVMEDNFIVFVDTLLESLYQMDTHDPLRYRKVAKTGPNPVAVAYDPVGKRIYFTDVNEETINSVALDGTDLKIVKKLSAVSIPDGLAIEPNSRLLYYTDAGRNTISVMTLDGSLEKTLVYVNNSKPRAIQLDPVNKKMYWSDWGLGQIEVANMDGSGRQLVTNNTLWPNGLALDVRKQLLYFCDWMWNNIEVIDLNDNNALTVILSLPLTFAELFGSSSKTHFFGITLDETYLYISDWKKRQLQRVTRVGTSSYDGYGARDFFRINGLQIYNSSVRTIEESVCQTRNGGCSHLCIPSSAGRTCMCPNGQSLLDETTCS